MINAKMTQDQYYMNIAREVSRKSKCFRRALGAVIVRDNQIISTGYVGAIRKGKDCFEHGFCLRTKLGIPHGHRYELCRSVHAEQNAIINAARAGVSLLGGDLYLYGADAVSGEYIDVLPCFICKKMVINAGLARIICSTKEGRIRIFQISDWVHYWQIHDILEDKEQYGQDQKVLSQEEIDKEIAKLHRQESPKKYKKENNYEQKETNYRFSGGETGR